MDGAGSGSLTSAASGTAWIEDGGFETDAGSGCDAGAAGLGSTRAVKAVWHAGHVTLREAMKSGMRKE
jgi:hypothetical protein